MPLLFARLVQHLASYFSVFGAVNAAPPTPLAADDLASAYMEPSSLLSMIPSQPLAVDGLPALYVEPSSLPNSDGVEQKQQNEYSPSAATSPWAISPVDCVPLVRSKQRLAGHITKITLQTVAMPRLTTPPTAAEIREPVIVRVVQRDITEEQTASLVLSMLSSEEKNTSSHVPIVTLAQRKVARVVQPRLVFGAGSFEYGQSDCQVFNEHVNTASVVIVMLTLNPGPTIVQYVSLQPGVGFTAHLSAPATSEAPFNYVVMSE